MADDFTNDQIRRVSARFEKPIKCSVLDRLELLRGACVAAGLENALENQLLHAHGVNLYAIEKDLVNIESNVTDLIVQALLHLETEIAEENLFMFRDTILEDQFRVMFVDQLDFVQLSRYIRIMRPIVDMYKKDGT